MNRIELRYLPDGNFWRAYIFEDESSTEMSCLKYRNPDKLSSYLEVKCGGGKGNTYNPSVPNLYNVDKLEVIKSTLEDRLGCEVTYHNTASINDYHGPNN